MHCRISMQAAYTHALILAYQLLLSYIGMRTHVYIFNAIVLVFWLVLMLIGGCLTYDVVDYSPNIRTMNFVLPGLYV